MKDMRKEREQRKKAILSKIKEYEMINISFESDKYKLDQFNKLVELVDYSNSIDEIAVAIYMMVEDEDCTLEYIKERLAE